MKRSRFTEERVAHVLRQVEAGAPGQELIHKTGITEQTLARFEDSTARSGSVSCSFRLSKTSRLAAT
jgi:hypothetical protein